MFTSREDVIWAAGLFEGEGCFTMGKAPNGITTKRGGLHVILSMTDKDVVQRFQEIVGFGAISIRKPRNEGWKTQWCWHTGTFERFQAIAAMFWPWLGKRRRETVTRILTEYKAAEPPYWELALSRFEGIREALKSVGTRTEGRRGLKPTQRNIAKQFGVSESVVSAVKHGWYRNPLST